MYFHKTNILSFFSSKIPFSILNRLFSNTLLLPSYHVVSDYKVPHTHYLLNKHRTIKLFRSDMEFFLKYYQPIALQDLISLIKDDRSVPKNHFFLSFDDGLREIYEIVAPILLEMGIPATFFINTDFIDNQNLFYRFKASLLIDHIKKNRHNLPISDLRDFLMSKGLHAYQLERSLMSIGFNAKNILDEIAVILGYDFNKYLMQVKPFLTTEQIKHLLSKGFTIGAHSINHPEFGTLNYEEQLYQAIESLNRIRNIFSIDYGAFAFPFNDIGISKRFFSEMNDSGICDIFFGTSDLRKCIIKNNFERFFLEGLSISARHFTSAVYLKLLLYRAIGKETIQRQ